MMVAQWSRINCARLAENAQRFKAEILSIMRPYMTGVNVSVRNFPSPDQKQTAANDMYASSGANFSHTCTVNERGEQITADHTNERYSGVIR